MGNPSSRWKLVLDDSTVKGLCRFFGGIVVCQNVFRFVPVYLYTISNCTQPKLHTTKHSPPNPFSFHHSTHVHKTFYRKRVSKSMYVLFPPHQNTLPPYSPQSPQASPLSPHSPLLITLPPHQNDTPTNFETGRAGNTFPSLFAPIQFDKCHWGVRTKNVD